MNHHARRNGTQRSPLKSIYVARTVEKGQPQFNRFLERAKRVGKLAVYNQEETHLTFVSSGGHLNRLFRARRFTPADVRAFSGELQGYLSENNPRGQLKVYVDSEEPLKTMDSRNNPIALNIISDEPLQLERKLVEEFVGDHFGQVPDFADFEPHITIGHYRGWLAPEYRENPLLLFPESTHVPASIALNGLNTYLDNIGEK